MLSRSKFYNVTKKFLGYILNRTKYKPTSYQYGCHNNYTILPKVSFTTLQLLVKLILQSMLICFWVIIYKNSTSNNFSKVLNIILYFFFLNFNRLITFWNPLKSNKSLLPKTEEIYLFSNNVCFCIRPGNFTIFPNPKLIIEKIS